MNIPLTALTRPRISSGVSSCTKEARITMLIMSAAPSTTSTANENQNEVDIVVTLPDGRWGAFEVKMNPEDAEKAAATLLSFAGKVNQAKAGPPAALGIITTTGFAYRRDDGVSVLPLMQDAEVTWRSEIHGEHVAEVLGNQSMHWVTDGRRKFIWFSGSGMEQFFALDGDPTESRNLIHQPDRAEKVAGWRNRLVAHLDGREEGFVRDGRLVADRPVQTEMSWVRALLG